MKALVIGAGYGAAVLAPALASEAADTVLLARGRRGALQNDHPRILTTEDWRNALTESSLDIVVIAVPPTAQITVLEAVLSAGRPTLVEKPGGMVADDLIDLAHKYPATPLAVGYEFRFMRGLQELIALVQSGAIGRLRAIDVDWLTSGWARAERPWSWRCLAESGGGALRDMMTHCIDYLRCLTPSPIVDCKAEASIRHSRRFDTTGTERAVSAPDLAHVEITLADNIQIRLHVCTALDSAIGHKLRVRGDEGELIWEHPAPFTPGTEQLTRLQKDGDATDLRLPLDPGGSADTRLAAARRMFRDFLAYAAGQRTNLTATPESAARVLRDVAFIEKQMVMRP